MKDPVVVPWRDRLSRALMLVVALGASVAFASVTWAVAASAETQAPEISRALGYLAFSAIFILLALRPRQHPGLWEISFLGALALGLSADVAAVDAVIALVIGTCYFLTRGYLAWNVAEPHVTRAAGTTHVMSHLPSA